MTVLTIPKIETSKNVVELFHFTWFIVFLSQQGFFVMLILVLPSTLIFCSFPTKKNIIYFFLKPMSNSHNVCECRVDTTNMKDLKKIEDHWSQYNHISILFLLFLSNSKLEWYWILFTKFWTLTWNSCKIRECTGPLVINQSFVLWQLDVDLITWFTCHFWHHLASIYVSNEFFFLKEISCFTMALLLLQYLFSWHGHVVIFIDNAGYTWSWK